MFEAKVIEHSIAPNGVELATTLVKYPRYVHSEVLTHRVFSRNASSSRAIPVKRLVETSLTDMVKPIRWGLNQPGMQASELNLTGEALREAEFIWLDAAIYCANASMKLSELGLHKQWANRLTEWFGHISVVITSTEWSNWDELRDHSDAQPEIQELARIMQSARDASTPVLRPRDRENVDAWHLPFISQEERELHRNRSDAGEYLAKASTARCARTSYLNHDGSCPDINKDLSLFDMLVSERPLHASPTEHQGYPLPLKEQRSKNFTGWRQHRELIEHLFK